MPQTVMYEGPTARDDISTEYVIRDEKRKAHTLRKGYATEVPDDVATVLLAGGDATKGYKFSKAEAGARRIDGSVVEAETPTPNPKRS